jgi:type II restriction enzyme
MSTLKDTINKWDYYVNWEKVLGNLNNIEVELNIMNSLIGKKSIEEEFKSLLKKYPSVSQTIPVLIACRQDDFKILDSVEGDKFRYKFYSFKPTRKLTNDEILKIVEFAKSIGLLSLLKDKKIKNVVDYVFGVEVGLDSNGRKNRGGVQMEEVVEVFVKDICSKNKFQYIKEATANKIKNEWGLQLTVDKSSRRVDFAILRDKRMYLIETNYYAGGGSKLKSTAGEYRTMYDFWKNDGHGFIWITDGQGWKTTRLPLQETFNYIDYVLNLDMIENNLLEDIIVKNL